jgi:uncharacterized protein
MNKRLFKTKQTIGTGIASAIALLTSLPCYALTIEEVPNPKQIDNAWVTDSADILNDHTESQLNLMISQLESHNGTEIAVVTVPETSPASSPKEFTTKLFNYWGIGKADKNNGVLFLVSTGDRRVEIETGYGIEANLPNAKVGNIIDTKITPQFKQGNYNDGTLAGTQALVNTLQNQKDTNQTSATLTSKTNSTETSQSDNSLGPASLFGLILIFTVVTSLLFNNRKHHRRSSRSKSSMNSVISSSGSCGSSNSNSSSGSSFGGGESGGGGAGGSY